MNTPESNVNGAQAPSSPKSNPTFNPIDESARLAAESKRIFSAAYESAVKEAVASERVRIIVAIKNCSRFFRNCASNAEAHLVVAQMPQDRQSAGATHVTYLRAANHLDALVNKLS